MSSDRTVPPGVAPSIVKSTSSVISVVFSSRVLVTIRTGLPVRDRARARRFEQKEEVLPESVRAWVR